MAALCTCVMAWSKVTGICLNSASIDAVNFVSVRARSRSEEHTYELQSLMRISYAVFCLKKKNAIIKSALQGHNITNPNEVDHSVDSDVIAKAVTQLMYDWLLTSTPNFM